MVAGSIAEELYIEIDDHDREVLVRWTALKPTIIWELWLAMMGYLTENGSRKERNQAIKYVKLSDNVLC